MRRLVPWVLALAVLALPLGAEAQFGRGRQGGPGGQSGIDEGPHEVRGFPLRRPEVHALFESGADVRPALKAYEEVMAEAEAAGRLVTATRAGASAIVVANKLGMLQKVLTLAPRVIDVGMRAPRTPEAIRGVLETAASLSRVYRNVNDGEAALRVLNAAAAFAKTPEVTAHRKSLLGALGAVAQTLSTTELAAGNRPGALAHGRESVQFGEEAVRGGGGSSRGANRQLALALLNLAQVQVADGRLDEAAAGLTQGARHARVAGHPDVTVDIARETARVALLRGDARAALAGATAARADAERGHLGSRLVNIDRLMAEAHAALNDMPQAMGATRRMLDGVERGRADLTDSTRRAGFLDQRRGMYEFAVGLALRANQTGEAFEIAERARSRAFLDLLGNAALSKGRTRALAQEEAALRARLAEAATAPDEGREDGATAAAKTRARVEAVERDYRAFLERVRRESGEQASLMAVEPVTIAEIQTLLPADTVLVEYMVTGREVVMWLVDKTSVQVRRTPAPRAALITAVRDFRTTIASRAALADVHARAQALHAILVSPAGAALAGKRLIVVPHDVLHYLPFGALRGADGRWLVEDHAIATVPSASVLKFLADKGANTSDRVLAFGNPDLGPGLALRFAEHEVRALGRRAPATTTVLTGGAATESRFKRDGGGAGLLHFAVHGELNEEDPMASALLLVPGDGEDGKLEVRELFATELNARLVVLAACETGLGKLSSGDELVGLQRAFLYAGTPAVLTTLWKVDDRASYALMDAFYDGLGARGPVEALRAAQRSLMANFPHPFSWAAFGVTGAPR